MPPWGDTQGSHASSTEAHTDSGDTAKFIQLPLSSSGSGLLLWAWPSPFSICCGQPHLRQPPTLLSRSTGEAGHLAHTCAREERFLPCRPGTAHNTCCSLLWRLLAVWTLSITCTQIPQEHGRKAPVGPGEKVVKTAHREYPPPSKSAGSGEIGTLNKGIQNDRLIDFLLLAR